MPPPIDTTIYDPQNLVENTVAELMRRPAFQLHRFDLDMPGVYALFYTGPYPDYAPIRSPEATMPIYVGQTKRLGNRLQSHCKTLDEVFNLDLADFLCRAVPLPAHWIIPVENAVIQRFRPWWNDPEYAGFGNDGSPRVSGRASKWDIIHPGRKSALGRERPSEAAAAMIALQAAHTARLATDCEGLLDWLPRAEPGEPSEAQAQGSVEPKDEGGASVFDIFK